VLVAAFEGWNDAGEAASRAVAQISTAIGAQAFAHIDAEEFFDFQIVRPSVRLTEAGRTLDWPRTRFSRGDLPAGDRQVVLLEGVEPNLRWRTFTDSVVEVAARLGAEMVLTVGALQTDTPHTHPVPLTASSADARLAAQFALEPSTYEGPTGIIGVLHDAFTRSGLPAVSLWAGVPHYLAGATYLPAALRLADEVGRLLAADLPLRGLAEEAAGQADDIATLVSEDEDLADYVRELEERAGQASRRSLPTPGISGEELAAELERFLRDRGDG
jgi:hypothetical protein